MNFEKGNGLLPAIIQDAITGKVLMLGFMNEQALSHTKNTGKVTFFSRTKQRLWTKGETSGNFLLVKEILTDCDDDSILIKAKPAGPACHTGADTCFNESNSPADFLVQLESIISSRRENLSDNSYTSSLFKSGIDKIAQKVGEEATETVIESLKNDQAKFKEEAADLLFHLMVLIKAMNLSLEDIKDVLARRHKK